MNEPEPIPDHMRDLIDDYLHGLLDEVGMDELAEGLRADSSAREFFVRYARLHTDLHIEMRARDAGERVLNHIDQIAKPLPGLPSSPASLAWFTSRRGLAWKVLALAASLLLVLTAAWWLVDVVPFGVQPRNPQAIAWLVNAQNCLWSDGEPAGNMQGGKVLTIEQGLAEIRFLSGAIVVLEGPASLELVSAGSARLLRGRLTARVPEIAHGFQIFSPRGRIVDLGTEFGIAVAADGTTDVYVFRGKVEAHPTKGDSPGQPVNLQEKQAASIGDAGVSLKEAQPQASQFVREITLPPIQTERKFVLDFQAPVQGTLHDAAGFGTGLTHRLPGTGRDLQAHDSNLRLDTKKGLLELTTTNSDINNQYQLHHGEYVGIQLSDLGFTGTEDFEVTVTIPEIPALEVYGQFGLFAGTSSDHNIRGGMLNSRRTETGLNTQFLVNNGDGLDSDLCKVGLLSPGADLRLTLRRIGGKYSLTVENLTTGSASTLTIRHPDFLDDERDLFVGLFGANAQSQIRKTLVFKAFSVVVRGRSAALSVGQGRALTP